MERGVRGAGDEKALKEKSMHRLRWGGLLALLGALGLLAQGTARTQEKGAAAVDLKVVKYEGLAEAIQQSRGKVVIVDFWSNDCIPCKQAMPHLVKLYNEHKKDGLTAITVAVDLAWEKYTPTVHDSLLRFLKKQGATFPNFVLDTSKQVLQEKLRVELVPCVYVFNRQGKWTQFPEGIKPDELDALVKKLLAEK
jgi:thiol-disulfide isomerase/thioredoxin